MNHLAGLEGLDRDLSTVVGGHDLALFALKSRSWVFPQAEPPSRAAPDGFGDTGLVVCAFGSEHLIADGGMSLTDDVVLEVASFLQDEAIDQLGRGWPELVRDGQFEGLLTCQVRNDALWWCRGAEPVVAVGHLIESG